MRPAQVLMNSANKAKKGGINIPVELTPLFAAMGIAIASACYFTYKKFRYDDTLRVSHNPELSVAKEVIDKK
ncbi:probable UPF0495 protein YPR010C-A [Saccharomycodes ludwigii]|uniref:Probable UPF0495 protein YPR010C-A n=1 Tax=Saccharomycodes ludwigii TaxID=36035 RepID=A0A376B1L1_9ASCO|nr:hypothetical protein SCDLUD_001436 [Saccharomycodes ludwigii]KAH3901666.1 hypothetical protein SCDLUD_001436 [Saccharomycodes ludwigii]SSD58557.1 probable UPF0495 protein YPR010C-A [Saccharomycodes ludwigii]